MKGVLLLVCAFAASPLAAQDSGGPPSASVLGDLNAAVEGLAATVAPSVVQILVTGYRPIDDGGRGDAGAVISRQHSSGSGAIIDADGYIVTNAHVVAGAEQVRVVLPSATGGAAPLQSLASASGTMVPARIVGVAQDIDLALLKVDVANLRPLRFANYDEVRQGELVFAFGSPEGLRNSVTMGVVSSVARQIDPDSPSVYVQTDATIGPGSSGGPLVNVKGEIVGLNALTFTESGGSQGLGFAIPSLVITSAIPQLREYGRLRRGTVGIAVQAITPELAEGLKLARTFGVIVSDILSNMPGDIAGVQTQDIITTVNGQPVDSVPVLMLTLTTRRVGDTVTLGLVRGDQTLTVSMPVVERPREIGELAERADPDKNGVRQLGIVGIDLDYATATLLPDLRIKSGVLVTTPYLEPHADGLLRTGDVIHALNTITVRSLDGLRALLDGLEPDSQIVLQIERSHRLMFVTAAVH
jgi:serine protease Do